MKRITLLILLVLSVATITNAVDFKLQSSISSFLDNNILKDSSEAKDFYNRINTTGYIYLLPSLEINLFGEYTYYSNKFNLSNLQTGGGFTFIPLKDSSRVNLYFSGSYRDYSYKSENTTNSSEFISKSVNGIASIGYQVCDKGQVRAGYEYKMTGYGDENFDDKYEHTFFAGLNRTILNNNSLDIEGGYGYGNFNYLDSSFGALYGFINHFDSIRYDNLSSYYTSIRFSRPLGNKSGISVSFSKKEFLNKDDFKSAVVLGYTSGLQDPFESIYDGESFQLKIKTYILPRFITSAGFAYLEKDYFRHVEETSFFDPFLGEIRIVTTLRAQERFDFVRRYYLNLQYPIVVNGSVFVEPSLKVEYTRNSSSVNVYDYDDFTISSTISFTFM